MAVKVQDPYFEKKPKVRCMRGKLKKMKQDTANTNKDAHGSYEK